MPQHGTGRFSAPTEQRARDESVKITEIQFFKDRVQIVTSSLGARYVLAPARLLHQLETATHFLPI